MIRDKDLNNLKNGLKAYFDYNPEGPKTLTLDYDTARKLLNLLENLDELRVDNVLNLLELSYFPSNELMKYVKHSMARKMTDELIDKNYMKFFEEYDPTKRSDEKIIRGSLIVLRREKEIL